MSVGMSVFNNCPTDNSRTLNPMDITLGTPNNTNMKMIPIARQVSGFKIKAIFEGFFADRKGVSVLHIFLFVFSFITSF